MSGSLRYTRLMTLVRLCAVVVLMCSVAISMAQQNNPVSATVQPAQVTIGDSVSYQVSVQITGAGQPSIAIPVIDPDTGLSTPSPAGQQSSAETYIVNGDFRSIQRIINSYNIRTSKEGKFTIPPATVTLNGRTYETNPVEVTVLALPKATNVPKELEGLVAAPSVRGNAELQRKLTGGIFVLPVLSKTDPYNGEQVRISYHLVIDPKALQDAELQPNTTLDGVNIPPMNEFITNELYPFPQDLNFQERKIGGHVYLVAPVYDAVIASTKSGKLQIEPFQISMFFRQNGRRQRRMPTPYGNDPFFSSIAPLGIGGNTVQVIAQSPPLTMHVKPLPKAGQPAGYGGAVGKFVLASAVDKPKANAYDDIVQLQLTLKGQGNAESLSPPTLPDLPGFSVLGDPETKTAGQKDNDDNYISSKTFTYMLRPTQPGHEQIPPIELSYFNPETESYESVKTDPISLEIAPGTHPVPNVASEPQTDEASQPQTTEADLRYISTARLQAPGGGLNWLWGPWGVVFFMVPPAIAIAAGVLAFSRSRAESRSVDPRKQATSQSHQNLKQARQALDEGDAREMAAQLAEGMRWQFAARFDTSAAEMTIPAIEERLVRAGAPADLVARIASILETCDSAQYAPAATMQGDARKLYSDAVEALRESEAYS